MQASCPEQTGRLPPQLFASCWRTKRRPQIGQRCFGDPWHSFSFMGNGTPHEEAPSLLPALLPLLLHSRQNLTRQFHKQAGFKSASGLALLPRGRPRTCVNPCVATLSGKREKRRSFLTSLQTYRIRAGPAHSPWHSSRRRKILAETAEKPRHSGSSPGPLNGVNIRVAFSARKKQVPEWNSNWRHSG